MEEFVENVLSFFFWDGKRPDKFQGSQQFDFTWGKKLQIESFRPVCEPEKIRDFYYFWEPTPHFPQYFKKGRREKIKYWRRRKQKNYGKAHTEVGSCRGDDISKPQNERKKLTRTLISPPKRRRSNLLSPKITGD